MPRAIWNGTVVAEASAEECETVEGNTYFPASAINNSFFQPSQTHTVCSWKGTASYYDLVVDGKVNRDAAWFYPEPKTAAKNITGYVAFWRGVKVEK
jgi:uncharacterized protein (DUF427 family)